MAPLIFCSSNLQPHQLQVLSSPRFYWGHMYRSLDDRCMYVYYEQKLIIVLIIQTVNVIILINYEWLVK